MKSRMRMVVALTLVLSLFAPVLEAAAVPRPERCGFAGPPGQCVVGMRGWQLVQREFRRGYRDQDRARDAYRSGDVLPLSQILSGVRRQFPGKLLDANLSRRGDAYVYVIKLLDRDNRVRVIWVDAQTGGVLAAR